MLYELSAQWERNGYHDSDWYCITYNTETAKVEKTCVGTTRGYMTPPPMSEPDETILALAEIELAKTLFERLKNSWQALDFNGDYPVSPGETLEVKRAVNTGRRMGCSKCNCSGKWVNPKKESDVRECFSCSGRGIRNTILKDSAGKIIKAKIPKGALVEVVFRERVPDQYGRHNFDKYYLWCKGCTEIQPVRISIESLTRPYGRAEELAMTKKAKSIAKSREFLKWLA